MRIPDIGCWIATGSVKPSTDIEYVSFELDGYDVYIQIDGQRYRITDKELEQYKVEKIY